MIRGTKLYDGCTPYLKILEWGKTVVCFYFMREDRRGTKKVSLATFTYVYRNELKNVQKCKE